MDINDIMKELQEIKENPESLSTIDSKMMVTLKEIIKIERKHLYGLKSSSVANRRDAIQELISDILKNKGR